MSAWAKVGAKCVCIVGGDKWRANITLNAAPEKLPTKGEVLTIREVRSTPSGLGLFFVEYPAARLGCDVNHFRPLASTKTEAEDVALFTHHLEMGEPVVVGGVSYRSLGRA